MKYMGSKNRIAKHVLPIMLDAAKEAGITKWVEPFVGGGNMIDKVPETFERIGYDLNPHTIQAMIDIRDIAKELPDAITEEQYKDYLGRGAESITSWVRFVCSFGGKFEAGMARESAESNSAKKRGYVRNFAAESKRNALKQQPKIQEVKFVCSGYEELSFTESLIYCDPPYQATTGYATGGFSHEHFFDWCRKQASQGNIVFVSEYECPEDFECVWEMQIKTNFDSNRSQASKVATEKLFRVKQCT